MIIIKSTNFTDGESGDFALKMVPWSQVGRVRFYSDTPRYQSLTNMFPQMNAYMIHFPKPRNFWSRFVSFRGVICTFFFGGKTCKIWTIRFIMIFGVIIRDASFFVGLQLHTTCRSRKHPFHPPTFLGKIARAKCQLMTRQGARGKRLGRWILTYFYDKEYKDPF